MCGRSQQLRLLGERQESLRLAVGCEVCGRGRDCRGTSARPLKGSGPVASALVLPVEGRSWDGNTDLSRLLHPLPFSLRAQLLGIVFFLSCPLDHTTHMRIHTYYTHTHACTHVQTSHAHIYTCVHIYTHTNTYSSMHTHTYASSPVSRMY